MVCFWEEFFEMYINNFVDLNFGNSVFYWGQILGDVLILRSILINYNYFEINFFLRIDLEVGIFLVVD